MNYRCTIDCSTTKKSKQLLEIKFEAPDDKEARILMNAFLHLIASHALVNTKDCNTDLYREEWVNGI